MLTSFIGFAKFDRVRVFILKCKWFNIRYSSEPVALDAAASTGGGSRLYKKSEQRMVNPPSRSFSSSLLPPPPHSCVTSRMQNIFITYIIRLTACNKRWCLSWKIITRHHSRTEQLIESFYYSTYKAIKQDRDSLFSYLYEYSDITDIYSWGINLFVGAYVGKEKLAPKLMCCRCLLLGSQCNSKLRSLFSVHNHVVLTSILDIYLDTEYVFLDDEPTHTTRFYYDPVLSQPTRKPINPVFQLLSHSLKPT